MAASGQNCQVPRRCGSWSLLGRRCPQVYFLAPTRARVELPGLRRLPDPAQFQQFVVGPEVARQQPAVGDAAVDGEVAGDRLRQGFLPCLVARALIRNKRSEARRVGKEVVSTVRFWWSRDL